MGKAVFCSAPMTGRMAPGDHRAEGFSPPMPNLSNCKHTSVNSFQNSAIISKVNIPLKIFFSIAFLNQKYIIGTQGNVFILVQS